MSSHNSQKALQELTFIEYKGKTFRALSWFLYVILFLSALFCLIIDTIIICHLCVYGFQQEYIKYTIPIITISFIYVFLAPILIMRAIINNFNSIDKTTVDDDVNDVIKQATKNLLSQNN
ncbi:hypothetical protein BZ13_1586 [Francisella philomiragia subsp. philomiragia ATCC 25015]|uniref:hypothetical protein n=1 Tax=Francisella TaxID=262 RepID=UPI0001AF793F|nr:MULTISPECIES: hypothetical protein [Francisella]AJI74805.1 hypothetical protein BZ13_1586 [Francisella philomiragia subsp. philomiragia ATCC 25015]APA82414.1 hypothetical protein N894_0430 [Francisella tularensis subsp. novicida PA10-7858]EET20230.1 predicted protein [Francisella philomiragia subsp. philomiragia ATCC 25015]MBK2237274.1 hypothetical protein [Francisella philomiragia]